MIPMTVKNNLDMSFYFFHEEAFLTLPNLVCIFSFKNISKIDDDPIISPAIEYRAFLNPCWISHRKTLGNDYWISNTLKK